MATLPKPGTPEREELARQVIEAKNDGQSWLEIGLKFPFSRTTAIHLLREYEQKYGKQEYAYRDRKPEKPEIKKGGVKEVNAYYERISKTKILKPKEYAELREQKREWDNDLYMKLNGVH